MADARRGVLLGEMFHDADLHFHQISLATPGSLGRFIRRSGTPGRKPCAGRIRGALGGNLFAASPLPWRPAFTLSSILENVLRPVFLQCVLAILGGAAMGSVRSQNLQIERGNASAAVPPEPAELAVLREENQKLRELVIQLSKIVVRNVMDRH
jgi:hypothetical protein